MLNIKDFIWLQDLLHHNSGSGRFRANDKCSRGSTVANNGLNLRRQGSRDDPFAGQPLHEVTGCDCSVNRAIFHMKVNFGKCHFTEFDITIGKFHFRKIINVQRILGQSLLSKVVPCLGLCCGRKLDAHR